MVQKLTPRMGNSGKWDKRGEVRNLETTGRHGRPRGDAATHSLYGTRWAVNFGSICADTTDVPPRPKVFNVVTKLAVGGAQETALRYCSHFDRDRWATVLVTGPDSSPEGDLFAEAGDAGVPVFTVPALHRPIRPWADVRAVVQLVHLFRSGASGRRAHPQQQGRPGRTAGCTPRRGPGRCPHRPWLELSRRHAPHRPPGRHQPRTPGGSLDLAARRGRGTRSGDRAQGTNRYA